MTDKIEVKGLKELTKALKQLDPEMVKELKAVNKDAAQVIATSAKGIVPRRSGRLANSIRAGATTKSGVVRAGNNGKVPYGPGIHFGVGPRPGRKGPHSVKPNPFIYSALDARRQAVEASWSKAVEKIVERASDGAL